MGRFNSTQTIQQHQQLTARQLNELGLRHNTIISRIKVGQYWYAHAATQRQLLDFIRAAKEIGISFVTKTEYQLATEQFFIKFYYWVE